MNPRSNCGGSDPLNGGRGQCANHPPPYQQMVDMICALQAHGWTNFQTLTINSGHSFHYWGAYDGHSSNHNQTVGKDVVGFLDSVLK